MRKSLLLSFIGSLLIISGCNAKEELKEQKSEIGNRSVERINLASADLTEKELKPGSITKKDRSNETKAPDFKLATIGGEEFYLSDFKGKVVMLNFWGTWCPPCRKEIPDLVSLQAKYNKDGLEIVGITLTSGSATEIQKFANKKKMNYTILTDFGNNETHAVTNMYGQALGQPISALPTTLLIDREGYIVKGYLGPRTEEVFYNDLKEYL
ncbi:MAG: TlpA disulfide reductase family protein [Candidatus Neomarinimicrobiota bacterium]